jgi:hypothetical protein
MARVIHDRPGVAHVERDYRGRPEPRQPDPHTTNVSGSWSVTARTAAPRRLPGDAGTSSAPVDLDDGLSVRTRHLPR